MHACRRIETMDARCMLRIDEMQDLTTGRAMFAT